MPSTIENPTTDEPQEAMADASAANNHNKDAPDQPPANFPHIPFGHPDAMMSKESV